MNAATVAAQLCTHTPRALPSLLPSMQQLEPSSTPRFGPAARWTWAIIGCVFVGFFAWMVERDQRATPMLSRLPTYVARPVELSEHLLTELELALNVSGLFNLSLPLDVNVTMDLPAAARLQFGLVFQPTSWSVRPFLVAAVASLLTAANFFSMAANVGLFLASGMNALRWIEYTFTAAAMFAILLATVGGRLWTELVPTVVATAATMLLGIVVDTTTLAFGGAYGSLDKGSEALDARSRVHFTTIANIALLVGFMLLMGCWVPIFWHLWQASIHTQMPTWVLGVEVGTCITFVSIGLFSTIANWLARRGKMHIDEPWLAMWYGLLAATSKILMFGFICIGPGINA